jgi:hypothetical protein
MDRRKEKSHNKIPFHSTPGKYKVIISHRARHTQFCQGLLCIIQFHLAEILLVDSVEGDGTPNSPWILKTPDGRSEYQIYRDPSRARKEATL